MKGTYAGIGVFGFWVTPERRYVNANMIVNYVDLKHKIMQVQNLFKTLMVLHSTIEEHFNPQLTKHYENASREIQRIFRRLLQADRFADG